VTFPQPTPREGNTDGELVQERSRWTSLRVIPWTEQIGRPILPVVLGVILVACSSAGAPRLTPATPLESVATPVSTASLPPGSAWTELSINSEIFAETAAAWLPSTVNAAIAAGPGYVAVGSDGDDPTAWISREGRAWDRSEPIPGPKGGSVTMADLIAGGPGLIAVGTELAPDPCHVGIGASQVTWLAIVWTSSDGQRWAESASFPMAAMTHIAKTGSTLVAIGSTYRDCRDHGTT